MRLLIALTPVPAVVAEEVTVVVEGIATKAGVMVAAVMAPVRQAGAGTTTVIAAASHATGPGTAGVSSPRRTSKPIWPRRKNQLFFSLKRFQSGRLIQSMLPAVMAVSPVEMRLLWSSPEVEAVSPHDQI
jgi:hypothetical protein